MDTDQIQKDIEFVKKVLPKSYTVEPTGSGSSHPNGLSFTISQPGNIRCVSPTGISKNGDAEDEEHWNYIMEAFRMYFGSRFVEVNHSTCFCHTDFTIYINPRPAISFDFSLPIGIGKEAFMISNQDKPGWPEGAESFTRQQVFSLLWTQRSMIIEDLKKYCGADLTKPMLNILENQHGPRF